jgi:hypothetical protein
MATSTSFNKASHYFKSLDNFHQSKIHHLNGDPNLVGNSNSNSSTGNKITKLSLTPDVPSLLSNQNEMLRGSDSSIYKMNNNTSSSSSSSGTTSSTSSSDSDKLNTATTNSLKHMEVSKFLSAINLNKYEYKFLTNGYDDLLYLVI